MKYLIKTERDLEKLAEDILELATDQKYHHAAVWALQGELGSGKTTFTKNLAKILGITESITSPTFVIQKTFNINKKEFQKEEQNFSLPFTQLIHIDSYRLDLSQELVHLGWSDNLNQKENLIVVEWPERITDILPSQHILLKFSHVDETTREVGVEVIDHKK
jgi:tRNA threonylcarbamoyladenosine biosynthesis protein TsaE